MTLTFPDLSECTVKCENTKTCMNKLIKRVWYGERFSLADWNGLHLQEDKMLLALKHLLVSQRCTANISSITTKIYPFKIMGTATFR